MKKLFTPFAVLAFALALLTPAASQAATKTKVKIGGYGFNGPGQGGQFQIEVKSSELKCKKKRKVTLYHEGAKIGSEKTISGEGTWVAIIDDPDNPKAGAYYATVNKENGCDKARSKDYFALVR